ncbi:hypothetical protein BDF21DRAFT_490400 [Thamnidium elegans]|nr:hypothetical protein BDF21DRAFT_490400 [Thamnidium elegans]
MVFFLYFDIFRRNLHKMCMRTTCSDCKKYTWKGCGLHIAQALAGLKEEEICKCKEEAKEKK